MALSENEQQLADFLHVPTEILLYVKEISDTDNPVLLQQLPLYCSSLVA